MVPVKKNEITDPPTGPASLTNIAHTYSGVWTQMVAGFTSHTFSADLQTLTQLHGLYRESPLHSGLLHHQEAPLTRRLQARLSSTTRHETWGGGAVESRRARRGVSAEGQGGLPETVADIAALHDTPPRDARPHMKKLEVAQQIKSKEKHCCQSTPSSMCSLKAEAWTHRLPAQAGSTLTSLHG